MTCESLAKCQSAFSEGVRLGDGNLGKVGEEDARISGNSTGAAVIME